MSDDASEIHQLKSELEAERAKNRRLQRRINLFCDLCDMIANAQEQIQQAFERLEEEQ
jgi:hypothetical protein